MDDFEDTEKAAFVIREHNDESTWINYEDICKREGKESSEDNLLPEPETVKTIACVATGPDGLRFYDPAFGGEIALSELNQSQDTAFPQEETEKPSSIKVGDMVRISCQNSDVNWRRELHGRTGKVTNIVEGDVGIRYVIKGIPGAWKAESLIPLHYLEDNDKWSIPKDRTTHNNNVSKNLYKPSWEDAPKWANWLAMDKDGSWFWYEYPPEKGEETFLAARARAINAILKGWENSVEERPSNNNSPLCETGNLISEKTFSKIEPGDEVIIKDYYESESSIWSRHNRELCGKRCLVFDRDKFYLEIRSNLDGLIWDRYAVVGRRNIKAVLRRG